MATAQVVRQRERERKRRRQGCKERGVVEEIPRIAHLVGRAHLAPSISYFHCQSLKKDEQASEGVLSLPSSVAPLSLISGNSNKSILSMSCCFVFSRAFEDAVTRVLALGMVTRPGMWMGMGT